MLDTIVLDREDWDDLLRAAFKSRDFLALTQKMYQQGVLCLALPPEAPAAEVEAFRTQFEVSLAANLDLLREALIMFEPDEEDDETAAADEGA